ncbi:MAG: PH domain-containing protein [bacterium]|nr:PH domain-containing protein [bacterium]
MLLSTANQSSARPPVTLFASNGPGVIERTVSSRNSTPRKRRPDLAPVEVTVDGNDLLAHESSAEILQTVDSSGKLPRVYIRKNWVSAAKEIFGAIGLTVLSWKLKTLIPAILHTVAFDVFSWELQLTFSWLMFPILFLFFKSLIVVNDGHHELGNKHLRAVSGRFSGQRKQVEVPYENILFVEVNQSFFERLMGVGTILVGRNTQTKAEIVMPGVNQPYFFTEIIKDRIERSRQKTVEEKDDIN